jgi:Protein of unknown function (DUF3592)
MRLNFGNLGWGGAILSILLSLVVGAAAIALVFYANIQIQSWTLVPARVTKVRETQTSDSDGNTNQNFCPTVNFDTADGQALEVDSTECANPAKYAVGDTIQVYYNPSNPNQIQIKGGSGQFGSNIGAAVLGLISVLSCLSGFVSIGAMALRGMRGR